MNSTVIECAVVCKEWKPRDKIRVYGGNGSEKRFNRREDHHDKVYDLKCKQQE